MASLARAAEKMLNIFAALVLIAMTVCGVRPDNQSLLLWESALLDRRGGPARLYLDDPARGVSRSQGPRAHRRGNVHQALLFTGDPCANWSGVYLPHHVLPRLPRLDECAGCAGYLRKHHPNPGDLDPLDSYPHTDLHHAHDSVSHRPNQADARKGYAICRRHLHRGTGRGLFAIWRVGFFRPGDRPGVGHRYGLLHLRRHAHCLFHGDCLCLVSCPVQEQPAGGAAHADGRRHRFLPVAGRAVLHSGGGVAEYWRCHEATRGSRQSARRPRSRWAGHGRGGWRVLLLWHLGVHGGRRLRYWLAAGPGDEKGGLYVRGHGIHCFVCDRHGHTRASVYTDGGSWWHDRDVRRRTLCRGLHSRHRVGSLHHGPDLRAGGAS